MSDFFDSHLGTLPEVGPRRRRFLKVRDRLYDLALHFSGALRRIRDAAARQPPRKVLIVGIEVPSRKEDIHRVIERLSRSSRHAVTTSVVPMANRGKFENIDAAIEAAGQPLDDFDWLVVTDDDIAFDPRLLDDLLALAEAGDIAVAQPAHAFDSHTTYTITQRRPSSLLRRTTFVEIGPLTVFRRDTFASYVPFPQSRWCYGIDLVWTELAELHGFKLGIVDGTPVRHLRPVAGTYSMDAARAEGDALLKRFEIRRSRAELFRLDDVVIATR